MRPIEITSVRKMLEQLGRQQVEWQLLWEKSLDEHDQQKAWQAHWEQDFVRGEVAGIIKMVQVFGQIDMAKRLGVWYDLFVKAMYEVKKERMEV